MNIEPTKEQKRIHMIISIIYLVSLIALCAFLSKYHPDQTNTIISILIIIYSIGSTLLYFYYSHKVITSIAKMITVPLLIIGAIYMFSSTALAINYISKDMSETAQISNMNHDLINVLSYNGNVIYFDQKDMQIYTVNNHNPSDKINKFDVYTESTIDSNTLKSATKFNSLSKDVKFAYIKDNTKNQILLQITNNNIRYLSIIDNLSIIKYLQNNDQYKTPTFVINGFDFYINNEDKTLAYMNNSNIMVFNYTESNIKEGNYITRTNKYISSHYPSDYISQQNVSTELIAEKNLAGLGKINLYTFHCLSCENGLNKYSDMIEIIKPDGSTIMSLANVDSNKLSEAKIWKN
jgi:hypothetical protein